ncbi:MAG: TIM barrel protein [Acidobacteria bacterium]|nr:TIM barrel protein [Acidobacteriota bacterium]MBI3422644.1 TIM barrel protein [Acidobacteriota bacterium]
MRFSRRQFMCGVGAAALTGHSTFAKPQQAEFSIGYDTAAWQSQTEQAVTEISALGYRGIQIRQASYTKYANRPGEFKALLAARKLSLVALAASNITLNPTTMKQEIADALLMAKWLKEVGGIYLQVADGARPPASLPAPDDYRKLGKHLTEIGKRTLGEGGIKLAYRNQIQSLGQRRDEVDRILDATDPKYVWLLVDSAHLSASGGEEVRFVRDYLNRLAFPHFTDVRISQSATTTLDGSRVPAKYDFVELGQGKVNLPSVFQILKDYHYAGWVIVALDRTPQGRTAQESAAISKRFIEEKLKYNF